MALLHKILGSVVMEQAGVEEINIVVLWISETFSINLIQSISPSIWNQSDEDQAGCWQLFNNRLIVHLHLVKNILTN